MNNKFIKMLAQSSPDHTINMQDLLDTFGHTYYCNANFHLSQMMSSMVKNGTFTRVKKGVYKLNILPMGNPNKPDIIDPNQGKLF